MTPDELRALAEQLEASYYGEPARNAAAYLRAQADAQPVAWLYYSKHASQPFTTTCPPNTWGPNADDDRKTAVALYTRPAPAAPQTDALPVAPIALVRAFNSGYMQGHHDTVEAQFIDIHPLDMDTYHADVVAELGLTAAQQAEPKREPLWDHEISKLAWEQNVWGDGMITFSFLSFARAVERAHGIGGSDAE